MVRNCSNRQYKRTDATASASDRSQDITFHRFPSSAELRAKWIDAIKRENFTPCRTSKVCSHHFKPSDFKPFTQSQQRRILKSTAVPSIFNFPAHPKGDSPEQEDVAASQELPVTEVKLQPSAEEREACVKPPSLIKKNKLRVPCCVVRDCSNRQYKLNDASSSDRSEDITFHYFPSKVELRTKWLTAIKRENFTPAPTSRVCSKHFKPSDFKPFTRSQQRRILKDTAVPSIFDFPGHLRVEEPEPDEPKDEAPRQGLPAVQLRVQSPEENREACVRSQRAAIAHDHAYYYTPKKEAQLRNQICFLQRQLKNTRARLRTSTMYRRRLEDIIIGLKKKQSCDAVVATKKKVVAAAAVVVVVVVVVAAAAAVVVVVVVEVVAAVVVVVVVQVVVVKIVVVV
ncbi:THAP domain-containing protein 1 [Elysia marginata]|uniref:THAP domain-containing protein 1 n=1 Tax=Elysia marginata TaxID=1093978 RepID=A0AAV4IYT8_9GAST|nr:THAP domain-containing protein 1 [Elysia marginata]